MFSNDRAQHSLGVARLMQEMALEHGASKEEAEMMYYLGWVHDIGYQFTENNLIHARVGGEFLRQQGYEFWEAVRDHGDPSVVQDPVLRLLNQADMQVDSKGNRVSYEERLEDIKSRYGTDTTEYLTAVELIATIS